MNRQMKRRFKRNTKQKEEYYIDRNLAQNILIMIYIPLLYMRKNYGFGKKRLGDMAEGCIDILHNIMLEDIDFDDISNTIYEETGVRISYDGIDLAVSKEAMKEIREDLGVQMNND